MYALKEHKKAKLIAEIVAKENYEEYLNRVQRHFQIEPLSATTKSAYEICLTATLNIFPYDTLKEFGKEKYLFSSMRGNVWGKVDLNGIREVVSSYVYSHNDTDVSYYLHLLTSFTDAMDTVLENYSDDTLPGNKDAVEDAPWIILQLISSIQDTLPSAYIPRTGENNTHLLLSSEQAAGLLGVLFLQRQAQDKEIFFPRFRRVGLYSNSRWLTIRIMSSPHDSQAHREDFLERNRKLDDVAALFPYHIGAEELSFLCDYSSETLQEIVCLRENDSVQFRNLMSHLAYGEDEIPEGRIREFFLLGKDLMQIRKAFVVFGAINALREYHELPTMDDYSQAPEDVIQKCRALLKVRQLIDEIHSSNVWGRTTDTLDASILFGITPHGGLRDYRLAKMLIQEPERVEEIVHFIKKNKTADYSTIQKEISCHKSQ